jgi:hypothetical protein
VSVGFRGFTAVIMKSTAFWVVIPCIRRKPHVSEEHIATIFRVKSKPSKKPLEDQVAVGFCWMFGLFLSLVDGGDIFLPDIRISSNFTALQPR